MGMGVKLVLLRSKGNQEGEGFPLAPLAGWSVDKSQPCGL